MKWLKGVKEKTSRGEDRIEHRDSTLISGHIGDCTSTSSMETQGEKA